ncbi:MAG: DUF4139 domain-containing protein, partial [Bacteroidetes bacterium]|nr:DUF4139 domain-containing protein [Bacteroidota bacterium]
MKTITLILAGLFLILTLKAEITEVKVSSKVENVTVFPGTAQVYRNGKFNIGAGISELIFEGISPGINSKSIQVKGIGDFIILDVQYRIKQPEPVLPSEVIIPPKVVKDIRLLEDSLAFIGFDLDGIINRRDVLSTEKNLLTKNKLVQGNSDTIPEIKEALDYLREQMNDINKELLRLAREEYRVNREKTRMETRLAELRAYNSVTSPPEIKKSSHQVVVSVQAEAATSGKMEISYIVSSAGWTPSYDIRVNGLDKPVQLVHKASVYQNSGEDWDNVSLRLSTVDPNQSKERPALSVLYLNYYVQQVVRAGSQMSRDLNRRPEIAEYELSRGDLAASTGAPAQYAYDFTSTVQTMTNVEYDIPLPYTIPSDGKSHVVAVGNHKLDAEYQHYIIPRLDRQAYLVARITDWEELNLLAANANIYYEGTYVGETYIDPGIMADTLELALGKDRGIIAERKKLPDTDVNQLIGGNRIKTVSYELKIKNTK